MNVKLTITFNQNIAREYRAAYNVSYEPTAEPLRELSQQGDVWNNIETLIGVYETCDAAREAANKFMRE